MSECKTEEIAATVGAFARVDVKTATEVRDRLARIVGVSLFDLDEPAKVGLVIEAHSLDAAHDKVTQEIRQMEGVLGVWPVYTNFEN